MTRPKKNILGFTIAELLVVIAIVGILTAFVMVNFRSGTHGNDLRSAGIELQQDFRLAQGYTSGGNSVNFCDELTGANFGAVCPIPGDQEGCLPAGTCTNGVPTGGYGVNIASRSNYSLFADTNGNNLLDVLDREILLKDVAMRGISIVSYKFGNEALVSPDSAGVTILFSPPAGSVHFYDEDGEEVRDANNQPFDTLSLLVQSDFVSNTCRLIFINRISGQISESQTSCSL